MVQDILVKDFKEPRFRQAFRLYFQELGYQIKDWDGLFQEMDRDGRGNRAYLRAAGEETVGFIQFCAMELEGWFFTEKLGFIREFWVAPAWRGQGHGRALLERAEQLFWEEGIHSVVLTTSTAPGFYQRQGYRTASYIQAKNQDPVYRKELGTL